MKLLLAVALGAVLGLREGYRFRLLASGNGLLSAVAALVALVVLLGLTILTWVADGFLWAMAVLFLGILTATLLVRFLGGGPYRRPLGAESLAENRWHAEMAEASLDEDSLEFYQLLKPMGIEHETALRAAADPSILAWYQREIRPSAKVTLDQSLELINLVHSRHT